MKILKRIVVVINILTLIPLLLADIAPFLPPTWWWVPNFLTYFLPYLLIVPLAWFFIWFFPEFRYGLLNLIWLPLNFFNLIALYQFSVKPEPARKADIKVVSYNVNAFYYSFKQLKKYTALFKIWNADILCLQEYAATDKYSKENYTNYIKEKCGYKHHYYVSLIPDNFGMIIFSKFPIVGYGKVTSTAVPTTNGIIYADIEVYGETLRVYNGHLQSYNLSHQDRHGKLLEKTEKKSFLRLLIKLVKTWRIQYAQALRLHFHRNTFPEKYTLFCGDLNNPPASYFYYKIKKDWNDAFIEKGNGQGHTFKIYGKGFRIDYIFASKNLKVLDYGEIKTKLSDHFPIFAKINFDFH